MRALSLVLSIGLGAVLAFASKLIIDAGAFRKIESNFKGSCREIQSIPGPEDMEYDTKNQIVFISSDSRPEQHGDSTSSGAIYTLDPSALDAKPIRVSNPELGFTFHPHGISIYSDEQSTLLFVINHREAEGTVEIFEWKNKELLHLRTLTSPLIQNNHNDIVAIAPNQFYVSHEQGNGSAFMRTLETYGRVGFGNIVFFDGSNFSVKAEGLGYGNGITTTPDHKYLLVAEMLKLRIKIYEIDATNHDLKEAGFISLNSGPDNITFDALGNLWIGAHPNLFKLKAHAKDHKLHAPAQILKVKNPLDQPEITEEFVDTGEKISASSVAVALGNRILLGSIFEDRMLDCVQAP